MATKKSKKDSAGDPQVQPADPTAPTDPPPPPRTKDQDRLALRRKMKMYYDIQGLRMQTQGRLTKKAPGATIDLHPDDLSKLGSRLKDLEKVEDAALKDLEDHLDQVPYYRDMMFPQRKDKYRGLGVRMGSVIIASFDIDREDTVSKMWAFAGLAPIPAVRCKECSVVCTLIDDGNVHGLPSKEKYKHPKPQGCKCRFVGGVVDRDQVFDSGKQMRPVAGEKLKYNRWLRTKLCGVLAPVLLKVGSPFRKYYDFRKQKQISQKWGTSDAHRHADAMRYMIKMLLLEIHKEWRTYEGLSLRPSYAEEKLGHKTSIPSVTSFSQLPPPPPDNMLVDMEIDELVRDEMS